MATQHQSMSKTYTKTSNLRIREFSDSHLGHNKTPTSHIIKVFDTLIPDNDNTGLIDIIIIAGDLFDRDLHLYQDEVFEIKNWMMRFLKMCKRRDIVVRVLEGTPRHDWRQSRWLLHLNEALEIGADIKYFDTVDIEHIPRFNIDVLYIPDEFKPTTLETQCIVNDLLINKGLDKVDFTVMHGAFPHQLPRAAHARAQLHDPNYYLGITRYFIYVGHIHQYSQYERILSAGSTDRFCHNDEKPKGMIETVIRLGCDLHDITFIENKQAKIFKTVNAVGLNENQCRELINKVIKKNGSAFHLRLEAMHNDAIHNVIDNYILKYPNVVIDFKRVEDKKPEKISTLTELFQSISLSKDNINDLLLQRINEVSPNYTDDARKILEVIMDGDG